MAKSGKPISDDERKGRTLKHLIHYGIKMMVRRDIGGSDDISNLPTILLKSFQGKTLEEIAKYVADREQQIVEGIRSRQRRSVEEIEERLSTVEKAYLTLDQNKVCLAVEKTLYGDPSFKTSSKLDAHYANQLVSGAGVAICGQGKLILATLDHMPIIPGTVVVNVYTNKVRGTPSLRIGFDNSGATETILISDINVSVNVALTHINYETGSLQVSLGHGAFPNDAIAQVDYEYELTGGDVEATIELELSQPPSGAVVVFSPGIMDIGDNIATLKAIEKVDGRYGKKAFAFRFVGDDGKVISKLTGMDARVGTVLCNFVGELLGHEIQPHEELDFASLVNKKYVVIVQKVQTSDDMQDCRKKIVEVRPERGSGQDPA